MLSWLVGDGFPKPENRSDKWYEKKIKKVDENLNDYSHLRLEEIERRIMRFQEQYTRVSDRTSVPMQLIGCLHYLKFGTSFLDSFYGKRLQSDKHWVDDSVKYFSQFAAPKGVWSMSYMLAVAETILGTEYFDNKKMHPKIWGYTKYMNQDAGIGAGAYVILKKLGVK